MLVTAFLSSLACAALVPQAPPAPPGKTAPQAAPAPQAQPATAPVADEFTSKSIDGITVRHDKSIEIAPLDFDAILSSLRLTRQVIKNGLGVELLFDPVCTVRRKANSKRAYYTDGDDKLFLDYPSDNYVRGLQLGDEKIVRYALPAYLQIWLFRSLTSTAGLDPRILDSLSDYGLFLYKQEVERLQPQVKAPDAPEGLGGCWFQLDTYYPGRTSFILNNLSSLKIPGHMVGQQLRDLAVAATDDPKVAALFDSICPAEPLLSPEEVEPGAPLVAASTLRTGRLSLFNGVPLLDVQGEPIAAPARMNDFETLFQMAITLAPDTKPRTTSTPQVCGLDVWKLYFEFRPRVARARDDFDYYLVLREFCGRFKDRSLGFSPSPALPVPPGTPYWSSVGGSGIKFARAGDTVWVAAVTPDSAGAKAGLAAGLEVVSVDGRKAARVVGLLADCIMTFDSCPSRQRAEAAALDLLLSGPKRSECTLQVRDPATPRKAPTELKLERGLPPDPKPAPPSVEFAARADQVGVVTIHNFGADSLQRFVNAIEEANKLGLKGIVIDVRGNEGITVLDSKQRTSSVMLGRLLPIDSPKMVIGNAVRRLPPTFDKAESTEITIERMPGANPFGGRLAVVVDAWTGGEAEWFALGFQLAKLGPVVGATTGGSVTVPRAFDAKRQSFTNSRIDVSLPIAVVTRPDGAPLQTVGIIPQIAVAPVPDDLKAGKDSALERAVELLRQSQ